jgi:hypothetical protein
VPTSPSLPLDYPAEIGTEDADALARAVRRAAGIADAVLFDSIELLENKGLHIVAADLPESVEAFAWRLDALGLLKPALRQTFVRRARAWFDEHGSEPDPSHRQALRHSRFSDLKLLVRPI